MSTTCSVHSVKQDLMAKVQECQKMLVELAEALPDRLDDLPAAESMVRNGLMKIGKQLLQGWCEAADRRVAAPVCVDCEEPMRHKGYVGGPLVTSLGDIHVRRTRYRCGHGGREKYPHDEQLRFPGHNVSLMLAKVIARLGAQLPFEQARQNLQWDYQVRLCKQTIQLVCEDAGLAWVDAEDQQREHLQNLPPAEQLEALPESDLSPEKLYLYADGTMLHTEGDWREIRVAKVVATDAADQTIHVDQRARFLSCEDFAWQLTTLAHQAGYRRAARRVFLADGARWLWDMAATHFPDAVQILDWYHLSEHVHQTSATLFGEGSAEGRDFSDERLQELWEGRCEQTLDELRWLRKKLRSRGKRECLRKLLVYLEHNRQRIDYPRYRELGLQVGSGPVESACKTLVGARCKQAGMRNWTRRGAEGVLRLRAALQTDRYDDLWQSAPKTAA